MVSVITNTYNRCELLKQAIHSVLNQSFDDFEYIIIDDGSTDNTRNEVEKITDSRLRYFHLPKSEHISQARNHGLDKARGSIVAFLDSDDYWHAGYLAELDAIYKNSEILSVISNAIVFNEKTNHRLLHESKLSVLKGNLLKEHLLNDDLIVYPSCFSFRFSGIERLNPRLKHGENGMVLNTLAAGNSCISMKELVYIRKHNSNISAAKTYGSLYIQGYYEEFVNLDDLKKNKRIDAHLYRKAYSHYLFKQADNLYTIGLKRKAWINYVRSFLKYPLKIKGLVRALLVYRFI